MITDVCQRWSSGRASYRPAREVFDPSAFDVVPIADDSTAKSFVLAHHYSASYPAARFRFGLFASSSSDDNASELQGVAVFSVPCNPATLACLPCPVESACELGRLVLLDDVRANAESWFVARCFELLRREGVAGVVSFSDPVPRCAVDGEQVFKGHVGTVYQASNAIYLGRSRASVLRLLPDGSVLHNRALAKLRAHVKGERYVRERLETWAGAPIGEDVETWLERWLPRISRRLLHAGNHKYAWALDSRLRRLLPASQKYPKLGSAQLSLFCRLSS